MTAATPSLGRFQAILRDAGLDGRVATACAVHFSLVLKWNPTHNLTRVSGEEEAAVVHYLDCALPLLLASPEGPPTSLLDVGSGAGFPGLVAAILWPQVPTTLVEPARKRASFLQIAAGELGLKQVTVASPPASASSLQSAPAPSAVQLHAAQSMNASVVLSRATFSEGVRGNLWPYVCPGGALWAWSSHHERDTWEKEASTWGPAAITWHPYDLPALPRAAADPGATAQPLRHGLLIVRRT